MIEKAIKITISEWDNIRRSLEKCGDIGKLAPEEVVTDDPILMLKKIFTFHLKPYRNGKKLLKHGYSIPEAADVFAALTTNAAERLGLTRGLAVAFGEGYS
ncbi:MAG: hypothetical protein HYW01_06375 [Deltaproteobacteria bacterium]|nr:hypothetical protein [Deltaproteobacteria bacterium]